uniref:Altered inheritance of mitochondria protein 21-like n=1 Tax=Crassostrea virginica TaxID=6565 RepID=A0A8B8C4R7_CRAVI|nr:altered inheritance of mitochondria protein 21-like [Crassostrea virginica]
MSGRFDMATIDDPDADRKGKEEMADLDVSIIASSSKKHKRGLKTMKKKTPLIDMNTSVRRKRLNSSLTKKLNLSINSVQKQSLRANNRALAVNLERTKQELRMALEMTQELRREIQEKDMRIVTLERVSGLRNEEIEEEVLRRVEQNHATLRGILTAMGESLFSVSHNLSDALHHCVQSSRRSTIGSRKTSSVGGNSSNADLEVDINESAYQRSIYAQTQGSSLPLPLGIVPQSEDLPGPPHPAFSASAHDMSVIAEQTMCLDDIEPLSDLDTSLMNQDISEESEVEILKPHVSNNKSEKGKTQVSKLPQRVPRKEKGANSGASGSEVNNTDNTMVQDVPNVNIGQDVKGQNEVEKTEENVKDKSKTSKKDKKVKEKNEKAVEMVDRRGTFVVADAKDLNSEAKICTSNKSGVKEDDSDDRRKTFVKPQSPKVDVKNDRRGTFVVPAVPSESVEEPEPMEDEDQTRYFNTDMEMTEVLSFSQPISSMSSSESMNKSNESSGPSSAKKTNREENREEKTKTKDDSKEKSKENSQKNSGKVKESTGKSNLEVLKNKLQKIKSTDSLKSSKASKDESEEATDKAEEKKETETNGKSVVEMRVSKPGNFEYRVSRKQEDGTRQPVPLKPVSRSRSRGKVKLSKSTSDVITSLAKTPGKPKNVFDFGDRTPTVTLDPKSLYDDAEKNDEEKKQVDSEKAEKDQKSKKEGNKKSLKEERKSGKSSGEVNGRSAQSVKETKLLPDNPVYYVPLAKGSPAVVKEPARQSRRSRSKPRSYKEASSDEDDLEEEEGEVKSKAKGRGRSKSRKRHSSGEEEQNSRRTRSQSRGRRDRKKEEEEDGGDQPMVEKNKRQSRGRSRTRKNKDEDEEKGEDKVIKERASRSRTRKAAEVQETDEKKDDTEEVKIIRKTRSRSRARSVKRNVKEMEDCVTKDSNTAAKEKESENRCNEIQTEGVEKSSSGEKPRKSSKQFLESLRKSTDIGEKVEKQQTKAFLASLVNDKEKNTEGRKSTKHAEVLASSSSEEDVQDKMVEEGQRIMSVNESLVDDLDEEKTKPSATVKDKSNKRKHHEVDDDRHCKEKVEDRKQKAETVKESTRDTQGKVKNESVKKTEEKDNGRSQSGKQKDAKVTDKSKGPESTVSENKLAVNDRLSQFVRERGHPKPMMMEDDDDITFSDFDKLYKHVSAKRASNSNTDGKLDDQEAAREDPKEEKKENGGKEVEPENLNLKTPTMSRPKSTKSAAKSRSKKSSKKNSSEKKESEKENSVEENVSQSKKKLELLKKRLTQIEPGKPSLEPLSDVLTSQSLPCSPNSDEPDRKRRRRGEPVSYKEKPLNSKMRRGDAFFDSS